MAGRPYHFEKKCSLKKEQAWAPLLGHPPRTSLLSLSLSQSLTAKVALRCVAHSNFPSKLKAKAITITITFPQKPLTSYSPRPQLQRSSAQTAAAPPYSHFSLNRFYSLCFTTRFIRSTLHSPQLPPTYTSFLRMPLHCSNLTRSHFSLLSLPHYPTHRQLAATLHTIRFYSSFLRVRSHFLFPSSFPFSSLGLPDLFIFLVSLPSIAPSFTPLFSCRPVILSFCLRNNGFIECWSFTTSCLLCPLRLC